MNHSELFNQNNFQDLQHLRKIINFLYRSILPVEYNSDEEWHAIISQQEETFFKWIDFVEAPSTIILLQQLQQKEIYEHERESIADMIEILELKEKGELY